MRVLINLLTTIVILFLAVPLTRAADPLENAIAAENRYDWKTYFEIIIPLAKSGDAEAQFRMGRAHVSNSHAKYGVEKSSTKKLKWLHMAAAQCHAQASFYLGNDAWIMPRKDFMDAYMWYTVAMSLAKSKSSKKTFVGNRKYLVKQKRLSRRKVKKAEMLARHKIEACRRISE